MGRRDTRFLVVGHISRAHGMKGELLVSPLTDHPEGTYAPGVVLRLGEPESDQPDPDLPPVRVESVRPHRGGYLVALAGVDHRSQSERLRGHYLFREASELEPLADGELFYHQLLGMEVVTTDGASIGEIREVYELEPADMLEVRGPEREVMIPFLKESVVEVDADARRIVIDPPDGLLDL